MPLFPTHRLRRPRAPLHTLRRALAAVLAAGALVLAVRQTPPPSDAAPPTGVPVVVVTTELTAGHVLTAGDLEVAHLPPAAVPDGVVDTTDSLIGRALAGAVRRHEPITDVRLVGAGLATLLPDGQVAAPVRLADLAIAELVRAGDRIDVLSTPPGAADADVVAGGALVLATQGASGADGGLLLISVDAATAGRLAAAGTSGTLTVTLVPP